jgi:quinone-modifying oxidoreductase, subunit QmoC
MAERLLVQPDTQFIEGVMASGAGDLKKCFQCATCSAVCSLSGEELTFPRKQMLLAQWGLKGKLFEDAGLWLCHHCGDCNIYCPRGAKPAEVMGALRNRAIQQYAFPRFMGALLSRPRYLPLVLSIPAAILGLLWWVSSGLRPGSEPFVGQFSQPVLIGLFLAGAGLLLIVSGVSLRRMLRDLRKGGASAKILPSLIPSVIGMVSDGRFAKCVSGQNRFWGHMALAAGFVGLSVAGLADLAGKGLLAGSLGIRTDHVLPLGGSYMLFANISAFLVLAGLAVVLYDHFQDREHTANTTYFDWLFLWNLVGVVATWVLAEAFLLEKAAGAMHLVYYLHLVLVSGLFLYAPYSKFAHVLYRVVAHAAVGEGSPQRAEKLLANETLTCSG